jgi:hypothetical protein
MRRSPLAAAVLATAVLMLAGCATPSTQPEQTAAAAPAPDATPSTTPSSEVRVVGAAERPPAAFSGDCEAAISAAELGEALGYEVIGYTARDLRWTRSISAAGGLSCEWEGGRLDIIPRAGLGEAELQPGSQTYYFGACDYACAWVWEDESLWVSGSSWGAEGRTREEADAAAASVGPAVAESWRSSDDLWARDRTGWLPILTCDDIAAAVGEQLGSDVTAAEAGYHDPAGAATEIADAASRMAWCSLSDDDGEAFVVVRADAGIAWDVPWEGLGEPIDLGIPGIDSFVKDKGGYTVWRVYELTDGVNGVSAEVSNEGRWSEQQIATAVAAAAASDFQL